MSIIRPTLSLLVTGALLAACNTSTPNPELPTPTPSFIVTPTVAPSPSVIPSPTPSPSAIPSPSPSAMPSPIPTDQPIGAWQFIDFNQDLSAEAYLDPRLADFDAIMIAARGGACISASSNPPVAGSALTFSGCNGSPEQQISRVNQTLQIGGLCITAQPWEQARLQNCGQNNQNFEIKPGGSIGLVGSNQVFDIGADDRILTWSTHGGSNQQFSFLSTIVNEVVQYPEVNYPIQNATRAAEQTRLDMVNAFQPPFIQLVDRTRHLASFQGQVPADAQRVSVRFPVDRHFDNGQLTGWDPQVRNWVFSRTYAPPGEVIRIRVDSTEPDDADGLFAVINARTDSLSLGRGNSTNSLVRPANISTKVALQIGDNFVRNPYGGSIIIESSSSRNSTVWVEVSGGIRQPFFMLGEHTNQDWLAARNFPAPFAILQSPQLAIGLYDRARWTNINDPTTMMTNYEDVAEWSKDITGFVRGEQGVNRWPDGFQFMVQDVEISNGFAHAGFPIMAQPGFRIDRMQDSVFSWGAAHEIGHNYQHQCLSSYRYGVESTVNVWSAYVEMRAGIQPPRIQRENRFSSAIARQNVAQHFNDFDVWEQLIFQMQMIYGLPGGWDNYRQAMRTLRELPEARRQQICASPQQQWDIWYEVMSQVSGQNLAPHFDRYRVPLSNDVRQRVNALNLPMLTEAIWLIDQPR